MELLFINILDNLIIGLLCFIIGILVGVRYGSKKQMIINTSSGKDKDGLRDDSVIAVKKQLIVNVGYHQDEIINTDEIADFTMDFQKWKTGEYLLVDPKKIQKEEEAKIKNENTEVKAKVNINKEDLVDVLEEVKKK